MTRRRRTLAAALAGAALLAAACGGDDPDPVAAPDDDATASDAADTGDATSPDCPETAVTYENLETGDRVEVTSTTAASLVDGAAYTAYLADFELTTDSFSAFAAPEVPADGNLLTVAVTIFEAEEDPAPLEIGTSADYTDEFGVLTFRVTQQAGEELFGTSIDAEGTITLTGVGDVFCADVEYSDTQKTLSGTIRADTKAV